MLKNLQFELPEQLIAHEPASPRDHARLLVYDRRTKIITDDYFYNLLTYLPKPSLVVANNSKVEHCRMLFDNGKKEIFVLEKANDRTVRALVRPGKIFKLGKGVQLTDAISAEVTAVDKDGIRTITFSENLEHQDLIASQHVPLPPYIAQNDDLAKEYQTIYAKQLGSKAAPTAGLHFTPELKKKVQKERDWAEVTLHVGLGTFASLTAENLSTGKLHEEWYEVDKPTAKKISQADHVTAVGTTSVRTLESVTACHPLIKQSAGSESADAPANAEGPNDQHTGLNKSFDVSQNVTVGSTDIFIKPGYQFKRVNSLITNFHLPSTSLLLLVAAFIGSEEELMKIYAHAISQKYRFYSFGDAMLVL